MASPKVKQYLSWPKHCDNLINVVRNLYDKNSLVDVTLVSDDGGSIMAHKIVLSASSDYFEHLFSQVQIEQNDGIKTSLFFHGVPRWQLEKMVHFMYTGEIEMSSAKWPHFLELARFLSLKGIESGQAVGKRKRKPTPLDKTIIEASVETVSGEPGSDDLEDDVFDDSLPPPHLAKVPRPLPLKSVEKRMETLNKISQALQKKASLHSDGKTPGPSNDNTLQLPKPSIGSLKSPDCIVLEERFKQLVEGGYDPLKLRNLSVSSADFNQEPLSLPSTPTLLKPKIEIDDEASISNCDTSFEIKEEFPSVPPLYPEPFHPYSALFNNQMSIDHQALLERANNFETKEQSRHNRRNRPKKEQAYRCERCGKTYQWNYNLNRHMKFECGIENKFQCALCNKKFPYKQNAAIHLTRKHKIELENGDLMIQSGHIKLLPEKQA